MRTNVGPCACHRAKCVEDLRAARRRGGAARAGESTGPWRKGGGFFFFFFFFLRAVAATFGAWWHLRFDWRHETVRRLLHLARWVVVYVVANQIAYFIIIRLSGRIPVEGAYIVCSNAFIFFSLPHAIIAVSIFTALLPGMSARWTDRHRAGVRELFSRGSGTPRS